jgi:hypothetical protein
MYSQALETAIHGFSQKQKALIPFCMKEIWRQSWTWQFLETFRERYEATSWSELGMQVKVKTWSLDYNSQHLHEAYYLLDTGSRALSTQSQWILMVQRSKIRHRETLPKILACDRGGIGI